MARITEPPLADSGSARRWAVLVQAALGACFFAANLVGSVHAYALHHGKVGKAPLSGIWEVDEFKASNSQPLLTNKIAAELHLGAGEGRWSRFAVEQPGEAVLQLQNGVLDFVNIAVSKDHTVLDMNDSADPNWKAHFTFRLEGEKLLHLQGAMNGVPVEIALHTREGTFRLTSDEYHIIRNYK